MHALITEIWKTRPQEIHTLENSGLNLQAEFNKLLIANANVFVNWRAKSIRSLILSANLKAIDGVGVNEVATPAWWGDGREGRDGLCPAATGPSQ